MMGLMVRNLLYGAGTINLSPLSFAICTLVAVGVLATLRPARRAALVDPARSLRAD
jgi:ABC-type lipoprotein release transport system permease subunit